MHLVSYVPAPPFLVNLTRFSLPCHLSLNVLRLPIAPTRTHTQMSARDTWHTE